MATRKKSISDYLKQQRRVVKLAENLGANGNTNARRRANFVASRAQELIGRIKSSKQYKIDYDSTIKADRSDTVRQARKMIERKYGSMLTPQEYRKKRIAQGLSAG